MIMFRGGSEEALRLLSNFCKKKISDYKLNRDFPSLEFNKFFISTLSFWNNQHKRMFTKSN